MRISDLEFRRVLFRSTGAALFALTSQANRYTEISSRLVPLFEAQTDVNKAMRDTVRIANEARTGLVPVADLYARLTLGGRDFGMSPIGGTSCRGRVCPSGEVSVRDVSFNTQQT